MRGCDVISINPFSLFLVAFNDVNSVNATLLKRIINKYKNNIDYKYKYNNINLIELCENLYNKGFSGVDLIKYIDYTKLDCNINKYKTMVVCCFHLYQI